METIMDSVYQLAIEERKSLEKRLKEIDDFLAQYDRFANTVSQPRAARGPASRLQKATIKETLSLATEILRQAKYCPSSKLLEEIRVRGYDVGGRNERAKLLNLSNALSRDGKKNGTFKANRVRGWSLKAPKSKGPVGVSPSTGPDLRGSNNTLSAGEPDPQG
jgi:hypothetical protein